MDVGSISRVFLVVGFLLFVLLGIVVPVSVYTAQKYAYLCYLELKKINERASSARTGAAV